MKKVLSAVLSLMILPQMHLSAQLTDSSIQNVEKIINGSGFAPQEQVLAPAPVPTSRFVPIKYRVETGPGNDYPRIPPHLTEAQLASFVKNLKISADANPNPNRPAPTQSQGERLIEGLMGIDILFVNPISSQQWDSILSVMSSVAQKECVIPTKTWDDIFDDMLAEAVKSLKDPHSMYLNPDEAKSWNDELSGAFVGIGVSIASDKQDVDNRGLKIMLIFPNSGAAEAGLKSGDIITKVGDQSLAGLKTEDMVKLVRGPEGTTITVKIIRDGQALPQSINVTRKKVILPEVFSRMLPPHIGYVYLAQFNPDIDAEVFKQIQALRDQGATSLVLDLRENPGGSVRTVASIASEFLKDGQTIVSFKHQGMLAQKYITDGDGRFAGMRMAVLIDNHSASASEIMSGAMQDQRKDYIIIGSRSYGKGSEQVNIKDNGRILDITINKWYTPDDKNIQATQKPETGEEIPGTGGIVPDITVDVSKDQSQEIMKEIYEQLYKQPLPNPPASDPVLNKAVEVLSQAASS